MKFKYLSLVVIFYICFEYVSGEAQLVRHNDEDDLQLMLDGKQVMPDSSCNSYMNSRTQEYVQSACYLHCILTGFGAGSCSEDSTKCECYGQGPPAYYSASYASKVENSRTTSNTIEKDTSSMNVANEMNTFYENQNQRPMDNYVDANDASNYVSDDNTQEEGHLTKEGSEFEATTE